MSHDTSLLQVLRRHKKKVFIVPAMCLLLGVLTIIYFPRTYRSEAKLFLQVGRESVGLDPTATTGQIISLQQNGREDEVSSAMEILRGRGVSEKVVEILGTKTILGENDPSAAATGGGLGGAISGAIGSVLGAVKNLDAISEREAAVIEIEESLDVFADRKSAVIGVTYSADSPHLARRVLQTIVEVYPQEYLRIHRNRQSLEFFTDQQELLRAQLDEAAAKLRDAKNDMGVASIDGARSTLEQQLHEIRLEQLRSEQEVATATARIADLQMQLDRVPEQQVASTKTVPNQGADLLRNQLYSLQVQQQDLLARYSEVHPLVMAITAQADEAEKVVSDQVEQREEVTQEINPIHRQLSLELKQEQSRLAGMKSRLAALSEQHATALSNLKGLNEFELRLDELSREEQLRRGKYMQYAENLEQARINHQLAEDKISNVSIAQVPTLSEKPISPRKLIVALASVMLALAGTATLVMAGENFGSAPSDEPIAERSSDPPVNGQVVDAPPRGRALQPK
ncbi:MAG: hypothetical protein WD851_12850 [Pirellulales bacterium]